MRQDEYYQYFVEGEDEEKIIKVLKTDMQLIIPGKISCFNVVEKKFTNARLMNLRYGTNVVLVFDTDTGNETVLRENIRILNHCEAVRSVICVPQVRNLEEELLYSCAIRQIKELTNSRTNGDFKRDLLRESNLKQKLESKRFDFDSFWSRSPGTCYDDIRNEAYKIKCGGDKGHFSFQ